MTKRANRQRRAFVRKNVWLFSISLVGYAAITLAILAIVHTARDFIAGAALISFVWLFYALLDLDGARGKRDGSLAEQWTNARLRQLRKAGWYVLDDVPFASGNVDHVAIGPCGVVAVETKFTSQAWRVSSGSLLGPVTRADPIEQALHSARSIRLLLKSDGLETRVLASLVVWGPGASEMPAFETVQGVAVMAGRKAGERLKRLPHTRQALSPGQVDQARTSIETFIRMREEYEKEAVRRHRSQLRRARTPA